MSEGLTAFAIAFGSLVLGPAGVTLVKYDWFAGVVVIVLWFRRALVFSVAAGFTGFVVGECSALWGVVWAIAGVVYGLRSDWILNGGRERAKDFRDLMSG